MKRHETPTYNTWDCMKKRCRNRPAYAGVKVCKRWLVYENFVADMGMRPNGKTLDRKNNKLGYKPSNCRWATMKEQNRNKTNNRWIAHNGKKQLLTEWAKELGLKTNTLHWRLKNGWSIERALES